MKNNVRKEIESNWARVCAEFNTMQMLEYANLLKKINILPSEIGYKKLEHVPVPSYCSPLAPSYYDIGGPFVFLTNSCVYPPGVVNALTEPPKPGKPICEEDKNENSEK